jgi:hypothetical protein
MPTYLRMFDYKRWMLSRPNDQPGEILWADAMYDLKTTNNGLSIWAIDDNLANLDRVIAAMAANRQHLQAFDFILIQREDFSAASLTVNPLPGGTPDSHANLHWHFDIANLTAERLVDVGRIVCRGHADRRHKPIVKQLIESAIANGWIDRSKMKCKID